MKTLAEMIAQSDESQWPHLFDDGVAVRLTEALAYIGDAKTTAFIIACASCSPYLERLVLRSGGFLKEALSQDFDHYLDGLIEEARSFEGTSEEIKKALRQRKDKVMLLLTLADLVGARDDLFVMEKLSRFADNCVLCAFTVNLRELTASPDLCFSQSGMVVLAMGKHGAGELNYSSDIDIVVFYEPSVLSALIEKLDLKGPMRDVRKLSIRVTQAAVGILQDLTADGYVFRTDLRLRPDPGASNVAVTIAAAERYYENYGQNWERAAFSKARIIGGHEETAQYVESFLRPFIWRRYLDFAAIQDIHSIKRQIHAVKGGGTFEFAGHDVKLGRGGIREIEFFVQTQQLILGGRDQTLRHRTTLGGLNALAAAGHVTKEAAEELTQAYLFLRHLEHRIQMVNDEQTHLIPKDHEHIRRLSYLCGKQDVQDFEQEIQKNLRLVHDHYADLFEESDALAAPQGSLVFTGVDDHPDTLKTIGKMGFSDAALISKTIREWHAGHIRATRSTRAREILTKLIPTLLQKLSEAEAPQAAFDAFASLLRQMPTGIQFFSLLINNTEIIASIIALSNISPRLIAEMARHSHLIDALLGKGFWEEEEFDKTPFKLLENLEYFEEKLNRLRRLVHEEQFRVTAQSLLQETPVRAQAEAYSQIADATIEICLNAAQEEMVRQHGEIEGEIVVVAMGRLGAKALTATSDLDLIFVYETPENAASSHAKSLDGVTYFTRYVRRLVTALSAQTEEGGLFEIDMALRPSGRAGPAAVSFSAFHKYYQGDAWTWEEMALVKARVIGRDGPLKQKVDQYINEILCQERDEAALRKDVLEMRQRLLRDKPSTGPWDMKNSKGGLTDIDFIVQYLSLRHAAELGRLPRHIDDAIPLLIEAGKMEADVGSDLLKSRNHFELIMQVKRAAMGKTSLNQEPLEELLNAVAARMGQVTTKDVLEQLEADYLAVSVHFQRLIGSYS